MKKVYSKKLGGEVFALAPEQLEIFRNAGYQTPAPEEVIADAGEATLTPPEERRAYVVLNLILCGISITLSVVSIVISVRGRRKNGRDKKKD